MIYLLPLNLSGYLETPDPLIIFKDLFDFFLKKKNQINIFLYLTNLILL